MRTPLQHDVEYHKFQKKSLFCEFSSLTGYEYAARSIYVYLLLHFKILLLNLMSI